MDISQINMEETNQKKGGAGKKMFIFLALIVLAGVGYWAFSSWGGSVSNMSAQAVVDSGKYQAVFLSNGQVYFGKVSGENSDYVSLRDVHYLMLKKPLQNQQQEDGQNQEQTKPEYSIVKLGKELHGPTSMSINREHILFIENLADDSKVVGAIKNVAK